MGVAAAASATDYLLGPSHANMRTLTSWLEMLDAYVAYAECLLRLARRAIAAGWARAAAWIARWCRTDCLGRERRLQD